MATESNLQKVHVFPSMDSYNQNKTNIGADDIALIPDESGGEVPAENITGTLPVSHGGTGVTANPSMLVNLGSTSAAGVFTASPRPGVTGTLPISRGGTGVTNMTGTDYTTNRPRGIVLQASTPSSVPNGCIVGVYS